MKTLKDRYGPWALITGASSGLGREFANQCAGYGLNVILTARRIDHLKQVADECKSLGVEILVAPVDLIERNSLDTLENLIGDREVGLLINNAGFGMMGTFHHINLQSQLNMIHLHCTIPVAMTYTFLSKMYARKRGGIINVSSIAGFHGNPLMTTYGASKAFLLCFSEGLWCEMRNSGIDFLTLCPGITKTEFIDKVGMSPPRHFSQLEPEKVVSEALESLGKKTTLVCGLDNKLFIYLHRFLTRQMMSRFKYWLAKQLQANEKPL